MALQVSPTVERATAVSTTANASQSFNELMNRPTAYEKIEDPVGFCEKMGDSYAAMAGAPVAHGKAIAMACLCEGINIIQYLQTYHTIQGRPTKRADTMLTDFRAKLGGTHTVVESSPDRAAIKLEHNGESFEAELTWEQAQSAPWPWGKPDPKTGDRGLKDNWGTPLQRQDMLWNRLVARSLRKFRPEITVGFYTPEEISDLGDDAPAVQQAPQRTAAEAMAANAEHEVAAVAGLEGSAAAESAEPVKEGETSEPGEPTEPVGTIAQVQRNRLYELFEDLNIPEAKRQDAFAKRGVKSVLGLSAEQADEMIQRMEARKRQLGK